MLSLHIILKTWQKSCIRFKTKIFFGALKENVMNGGYYVFVKEDNPKKFFTSNFVKVLSSDIKLEF